METQQSTIRAEISGSDSCTALGITARGDAPVLKLCQLLVEAGYDPSTSLHAYRNDVLCLKAERSAKVRSSEQRPMASGSSGCANALHFKTAPRHHPCLPPIR